MGRNVKVRAFLKKYRNDLLLIGALCIALGVLFLTLFCFRKPGDQVVVEENGVRIETFSLSEDRTFRIETEAGENLLVIRDHEAWIESADCRDKVCVRHGKIRNAGETIICLPHKLVVTVVGGGGE